jgi:hypothetical protein
MPFPADTMFTSWCGSKNLNGLAMPCKGKNKFILWNKIEDFDAKHHSTG